MTTFADDFERADGPVGNGWTTSGLSVRIVSGAVTANSTARIGRHFSDAASPVAATVEGPWTSSLVKCPQPTVKTGVTDTQGYRFQPGTPGANTTWGIYTLLGSGGVQLATVTHNEPVADGISLTLRYDAGSLVASINGVPLLTASDDRYADLDGVGAYGIISNTVARAFNCDDAPAQTFDASPEPLVDMAIPEEVTFTGTDTAWEPGTPGQPIFQVDKGTLDSQTVTSATTAAAMYTPPQAEDDATFTDPSTGLTDVVHLSTGFQVDAGESLPQEVVDYLTASAAQNSGDPGVILSTNTPVTPYGTGISLDLVNARLYAWMNTMAGDVPQAPPSMSLFDTLWWILNGHGDVDEDHNVLDLANTAAVESTNAVLALSAIRTDDLLTLQSILDAIGDIPAPDLSAILNELAAIRTGADLTLQDPIDAAEAVRGSGLPTIRAVLDAIAAIRGLENYSLQTIVDMLLLDRINESTRYVNLSAALNSIRTIDVPAIRADIHAVGGADDVDLTQLHDQAGQLAIDMVSHFGHVDTAISGVRGLDVRDLTQVYNAVLALPQTQVSLQPVLTAISNLSSQLAAARDTILAAIAAIRPADYPLWPGADAAELGVPVSGTGDLAIPGPLDGLLIDCTAFPKEIEAWTVAGRKGLKWAGHITFVSDVGYTEEIQFPGTDKRVVVPKSMLTCASALVHLRAGVQATVTPWYYAP